MKAAIIAGLLCLASMSWSDTATVGTGSGTASTPSADDPPDVTVDLLEVPPPGSEPPMHDPFAPYATGPNPWSYDQLTNDEKAVVDRGRDVTRWSATHDAYASASGEAAAAAASAAAQHQLGIENPGDTGVVP